jgi:hypothetical protein
VSAGIGSTPMTEISSRSNVISGVPSNQSAGRRLANHAWSFSSAEATAATCSSRGPFT